MLQRETPPQRTPAAASLTSQRPSSEVTMPTAPPSDTWGKPVAQSGTAPMTSPGICRSRRTGIAPTAPATAKPSPPSPPVSAWPSPCPHTLVPTQENPLNPPVIARSSLPQRRHRPTSNPANEALCTRERPTDTALNPVCSRSRPRPARGPASDPPPPTPAPTAGPTPEVRGRPQTPAAPSYAQIRKGVTSYRVRARKGPQAVVGPEPGALTRRFP